MADAVLAARSKSRISGTISRVASEPLPDFTPRIDTQPEPRSNGSIVNDDPLVAQLGRLASQHHTSEYNRLKFGPSGSPLVYVPYSTQMPDHYKEMQAHQTRCTEQRAWWPSENRETEQSAPPFASGPSAQDHSSGGHPESICETTLSAQISAAISSPLITARTVSLGPGVNAPEPPAHWQTSETHPIVISTIIPSELLPIIASHLERRADGYPTIFVLPRSYLLDCIIPRPIDRPVPIPVPPPIVPPSLPPRLLPRPSPAQTLAKSLKLPTFFWVHPTVRRAFLGDDGTSRRSPGKRPRPASFAASGAVQYADLQPEHHERPALNRNTSTPIVLKLATKDLDVAVSPSILQGPSGIASHSHRARPPYASQVNARKSSSSEDIPPSPTDTDRALGNLYMSSCPGKKVRLDGPVRGRSTVCRDLRSDLVRIKGVGVACIVCLLDDSELHSLGVTWEEYVRVAGELGIDVLRIPIPEGLPPNDPATLDSHLSKLIEAYTLRGASILVHCRGGVGRAGIIACCWMLKLGLCGWLDTGAKADAPADDDALQHPSELNPRTVHLVERMIAVVRRRRSPKAIETYEQVKFLVDYVEFLRKQAEPRRASVAESLDWFPDWETRVE